MGHELLNKIIRACPRLTAAELEMLMNVARRQREECAASERENLCLRDDGDAARSDYSDDELLLKKI